MAITRLFEESENRVRESLDEDEDWAFMMMMEEEEERQRFGGGDGGPFVRPRLTEPPFLLFEIATLQFPHDSDDDEVLPDLIDDEDDFDSDSDDDSDDDSLFTRHRPWRFLNHRRNLVRTRQFTFHHPGITFHERHHFLDELFADLIKETTAELLRSTMCARPILQETSGRRLPHRMDEPLPPRCYSQKKMQRKQQKRERQLSSNSRLNKRATKQLSSRCRPRRQRGGRAGAGRHFRQIR